jgi:hypothetical protein
MKELLDAWNMALAKHTRGRFQASQPLRREETTRDHRPNLMFPAPVPSRGSLCALLS